MSNWSFALSRRWFGYLALVIVFAIVCCLLGWWQLNRRAEAQAEIALVDNNYSSAARPVEDVLPRLGSYSNTQKWTPVELTGTYLTDQQVLVRNRPLGGNPGFEVLTPLQLDSGAVFIVDRGWIPPGSKQDYPDVVPEAPEGIVTVQARLKAGEPVLPGRTAPKGQISTINLPELGTAVGQPTYTGAYGLMVTEDPATSVRPMAIPKPPRDEGPHLSYAFQWFVFALLGFFGFGWALRQEYRVINADDPEERERAAARRKKEDERERTDAEVEDSILDSVSH